MLEQHPFNFIVPAIRGMDGICHFSRYVYTPDSLFDQREHISVQSRTLSDAWFSETLANLGKDEELAFHSTFLWKGRKWHFPMIDFSGEKDFVLGSISRLRMFLPKPVYQSLGLFESGRSLHGYSTALLTPKEWLEFQGRLLLSNVRGQNELVDARWIGHRLIGGFSSLRWSWNTKHYLTAPRRVAFRL